MYLYHYYDKRSGPFKSLSAMSEDQSRKLLEQIKMERPGSMCAKRDENYITKRLNCERIVRKEFIAKNGRVELESPYYFVVEHSPWLSTWYEQGAYLRIPIEELDTRTISFTYGDSMPTFSPLINDGKEYRRTVYTYDEILSIIAKYGLPQDWNDDGTRGPERYIEAHVWSDKLVKRWVKDKMT